jgi:dihydroflavonol-4-reductase
MFGEALLLIARGIFPVLIQGGFDWVDARDLAEVAIKVAFEAQSGSTYLVPGHWRSMKQIAELACEFSGRKPPISYAPIWLGQFGIPPMYVYASLTGKRRIFTQQTLEALKSTYTISRRRLQMDLGYEPRPFETTISDTLKWFVKHGYLNL